MAGSLTGIEKDFDIQKIVSESEPVWPILRWHYAYAIDAKSQGKKTRKDTIQVVRECFYGWEDWFGKADVLFFSDSDQSTRRLIEGEYYDRLVDPIIDSLDPEKCLLIEWPAPSHHPKEVTHTKRITSVTLIETKARFLAQLKKIPKIENDDLLKTIQAENKIEIDDGRILRLFNVKKELYKSLYKRLKPKTIFLVEYYRDIARVKAAKELGIKTIEVQHGSIGTEHPAYNSNLKIDPDYYPDQLLAYGYGEKNNPSKAFFYRPEQVHPIGNYLIDYINDSYKLNETLLREFSQYRITATVTLQKTIMDEMISFVIESAKLDPSILYLVIPREPLATYSSLPDNVRIVMEPNFYELTKYVDVHVTVFSSCAIEAPSLGVRNVLVDIDGLAKIYYGNVLRDRRLTRFVAQPSELVSEINGMQKMEKSEIMAANSEFMAPGYCENLRRYLRELELID